MNRKLTTEELRRIRTGLPNAKKQLYDDRDIYKKICISIFNKWLTEEECYQIYETDPEVLKEWRSKFENVIKEFYELTDVYLWRHKRHNRITFYKPSSLENLLKRCNINNQNWWDGHRYDILLPNYSAIYGEEWDWTNIIWHIDSEKIQPLLEIVQKSGLYILPSN